MREKRWLIKSQGGDEMRRLCKEMGVSEIIARLLINRGYDTPALAKNFLNKSVDQLCDPMLLPDIEKAVSRIEKAIADKEKIMIYGDYDVDGITSSTILYQYLKSEGGNVSCYIPDRVEEGYGVNESAIDMIAEQGCSLIITVDSGITAVSELKYAADKGMDVIVTDHHECADVLPPAVAVIDPKRRDSKYPYSCLAGVGVAFKLICALAGKDRLMEMIEKYSVLTAVGTIADVMPLSGENRILVYLGLKRIDRTDNLGLKALIRSAGIGKKKITTSVIGYSIAPRINAVGRVDKAMRAVELLLSETAEDAEKIAADLCEANRVRQEEEGKLLDEAKAMLESDKSLLDNRIIILANDNWHNGIIGIASSRINERFGLPTVLISFDGDMGKGSCRSSKSSFNIYAALERFKHYFDKFGGHMSAAGFSIRREYVDDFKRELTEYVNSTVTEEELTPKIDVDCEIGIRDINFSTIRDISMLEPYGTDNATPVFMLRDTEITEILPLSCDKHIRLTLEKDGESVNGFCFGVSPQSFGFCVGDRIDLVFNLDVNVYRGIETPQVTIRDVKHSEAEKRRIERENRLLSKYLKGDELTRQEAQTVLPDMDDFTTVFRYLRHSGGEISIEESARKIAHMTDGDFCICKLRVCLDVFSEMELICVKEDAGKLRVDILPTESKVNLNKSKLLCRLKSIAG